MIHKAHVENFLRINKISTSAPDEEIKEALRSANWHEEDANTAVLLLRGYTVEHDVKAETQVHLLRSVVPLAPETISSLLGVSVVLDRRNYLDDERARDKERRKSNAAWAFIIVLISSLLASAVAFTLMLYVLKLGPFYSPLP